jgi:hypothetical protein
MSDVTTKIHACVSQINTAKTGLVGVMCESQYDDLDNMICGRGEDHRRDATRRDQTVSWGVVGKHHRKESL